jgi:hypothetical protein
LQDSQMLQVAEAKTGEPEFRRVAARAVHGCTTIRLGRREIQRGPTEELMPRSGFRCTVSESVF